MSTYTIPAQTSIGHVHLKVNNLQHSLNFYNGFPGFEITTMYGEDAAFISAGGNYHHIGLNTWYRKGKGTAPEQEAGLFHTAILYPTRKDLAIIYKRLIDASYPFTGFADHGVSEALYLNDPDENDVELYWDKPKKDCPVNDESSLLMYSIALNLISLLQELE